MTNSLQRLTQSIDNLEELITKKLSTPPEQPKEDLTKVTALETVNVELQDELKSLKKDYQKLQETSKDVINELNSSIQTIEDYFKKQNANN